MAIKEGNVRLQITVSKSTLERLDELCGYNRQTRSRAVADAIWVALKEARRQQDKNRKEE